MALTIFILLLKLKGGSRSGINTLDNILPGYHVKILAGANVVRRAKAFLPTFLAKCTLSKRL